MSDSTTEYRCPKCGSKEIEEQVVVWVDPNSGNVTAGEWDLVPWDNRYCCNDCDHRFNQPTIEETRVITAEERFVIGVADLNERMPAKDAAEWVLEESHETLRRLIEAARRLRDAKGASDADLLP